ncbi:MAG: Gfo/Idh/MocA family oxidoreductase [Firmicutes bacterium]|nr:Gfo/Idh/MocA family oxidoreductase [Bacillota bacterium]
MKSPKAAIIGAGFIGAVHVDILRRLGVPVAGVLAESVQASQEAARQLGLTKAYSSLEELLDDGEVAVVHDCTPNRWHREYNVRALQAGKHVLSEKPLGMDSREAAEQASAAEAAARRGILAAVNFGYRYYPLVQQMRAMVQRGEIGAVRLVHGTYTQDWLCESTDYNWRVEPELGGKLRALGDIGSHWLDLAQYVTGQQITEVAGDLATLLPRRQKPGREVQTFAGGGQPSHASPGPAPDWVDVRTDDYAAVLFRTEAGAHGNVVISQASPGRKNHLTLEVVGSEATLYWDQEQPNQLWIGRRHRANALLMKDPGLLCPQAGQYVRLPGGHNEGYYDALYHLFRNFYGTLAWQGEGEGGTTLPEQRPAEGEKAAAPGWVGDFPTFAQSYRLALVLEAIWESSQGGHWVKVGA